MIHAAIFHMLTTANFKTWQMLGISQLYPYKPPLGPIRKHFSGFKHQQDLWCAMGKLPKHNCLTKPHCSLLHSEVFHSPIAGTFFPLSFENEVKETRNQHPDWGNLQVGRQVGTCCSPVQITWSFAEAAARGRPGLSFPVSVQACLSQARMCGQCPRVSHAVPQPRRALSSPGPGSPRRWQRQRWKAASTHPSITQRCLPHSVLWQLHPTEFLELTLLHHLEPYSFHTFSHGNHPHDTFPYTGLRATCCKNHLKWFGKICRIELYFPIRSSIYNAKHNQKHRKVV